MEATRPRGHPRPWIRSASYKAAITALVEVRKASGVSQRELALRLRKPRSFVSKIENSERRLDIVEFTAIARALGMAPSILMQQISAALPDDLDF